MNTNDPFKSKVPKLKIDKSLDQYVGKVIFKEKLEEANRVLKRVGVPNPETAKKYSESISKK
jgi:hypothetical protein